MAVARSFEDCTRYFVVGAAALAVGTGVVLATKRLLFGTCSWIECWRVTRCMVSTGDDEACLM